MDKLHYIPITEIKRIENNIPDSFLCAKILANIFRINALYMIMRAGSGHVGSSFSAMDIITWLFMQEMENPNNFKSKHSDTYFSSKGHDAPGFYSLLIGLGKLEFGFIERLRKLGGLPGHPDVGTPYIATNTGSLGMGISKAWGMAIANRLDGKTGRFYVLTGDGELQEGQIWESLQSAANHKFSEITVIVDHNKIQSDLYVKDTSDLGDLESKFRAFGWEVARCDGHDFNALHKVFTDFKKNKDRPQILIADTKKGKGVSFMEKVGDDGFYKFHSGAPNPENYSLAFKELLDEVNINLKKAGLKSLEFKSVPAKIITVLKNPERLIPAYGDELVKISEENKKVIVLNSDLLFDCGLIPFKKKFPGRFIECGIAEQDMVSAAGGLALRNKLPIAHSFACFLSTRPNEQIYNNATENTKIIYTAALAGILPAMPGHSHQSVRDISAVGGIPNLIMIQPSCEKETRMALRWAVEKNKKSSYLRLVSIACEKLFELPKNYKLEIGRGTILKSGKDAALIAYGPLMLGEAIKAARLLDKKGISLAVINIPWLNKIDEKWALKELGKYRAIFTVYDHYTNMGQGALIAAVLAKNGNGRKVVLFGVDEVPKSGQNSEVLKYHRLDFDSLAERIKENL